MKLRCYIYGQKTEYRLKVCLESVYHEKYVKFPITKKTDELYKSLNQSIILSKCSSAINI